MTELQARERPAYYPLPPPKNKNMIDNRGFCSGLASLIAALSRGALIGCFSLRRKAAQFLRPTRSQEWGGALPSLTDFFFPPDDDTNIRLAPPPTALLHWLGAAVPWESQ